MGEVTLEHSPVGSQGKDAALCNAINFLFRKS